jgi:hypothetical protein
VSASDVVSLVVASAAFVVAVWSLYLTVLRRAEIEVEFVPGSSRLTSGYQSTGAGFMAPTERVYITLFVANTGARGGLLERLRPTLLVTEAEGEPLWNTRGPVRATRASRSGNPHRA